MFAMFLVSCDLRPATRNSRLEREREIFARVVVVMRSCGDGGELLRWPAFVRAAQKCSNLRGIWRETQLKGQSSAESVSVSMSPNAGSESESESESKSDSDPDPECQWARKWSWSQLNALELTRARLSNFFNLEAERL